MTRTFSARKRDISKLRATADGPLSVMAEGAARRVISGDTTARGAMRVLGNRFWTDTARWFKRPIPPGALAAVAADDERIEGNAIFLFQRDGDRDTTLADSLAELRTRVTVATDPEQARDLVTEHENIGMLLIDLGMPDEELSLEALRRLRKSLAWSRLPALILVSPEHRELRHLLEEHGVTDYLLKPVDGATVIARLRAILAR